MKQDRLNALLQPLVEDLGYEFVGLEYQGQSNQAVLRIYIDTPAGVALEDCERVSREVAALLDVEDPIQGHYNLEISSPGLDRPLFTEAQFRQFSGCEVSLTTFAPEQGRRKFKGRLLGFENDRVRVVVDGTEYELGFANIARARLVPDYDTLLAARREQADD